ncbi:hypothetical protein Tco_0545136 [Tanacetum coccineum]
MSSSSPSHAPPQHRHHQHHHHNTTITTAKQPWLPPSSPPQPPTMGACGFKPPPSSSSPHHCHHRHPLVTATISQPPLQQAPQMGAFGSCFTEKGIITHRTYKNKGKIDSECVSAHDKETQAYLADYQDINGGPVAFGGSIGYITGKVKYQLESSFRGWIILNLRYKRNKRNIAMPELHNKMELLRERTGPLLRQQEPCLQFHFLPNTFWAEAVSTACYVLNRPLGQICWIKSDKDFCLGISLQKQGFLKYDNLVTKRVEENLHINFLENKPNVAGIGPNWLFDLDYLTDSLNYHNDSEENQANLHAGQ